MSLSRRRPSSGPWGKTRRSVMTPEELMSALIRARAKIPEGEEVTIDRLANLARVDIPAAVVTIKALIGKLDNEKRRKVDLPPRNPRYK